MKYRDLLNHLLKCSEQELDMDATVGTETGLVKVRSFGHVTDATDVDDLDGNTLIIETA